MDYRIRDTIITVFALAVIFVFLHLLFGTFNPFYVVSSGSMNPSLNVFDVIIIETYTKFSELQTGDIIVFKRPLDDMIIVHRIILIKDDTIFTKGDANPDSSKGTDFPITVDRYIGKVDYVLPYIGYLTLLLRPPINYIAVIIIVGLLALKLRN